jgi:enamine deaminase RidA (YjgF/YER057c/UK114 family)
MSRLFVSDILNQKPAIVASPLFSRLKNGALSLIEQKPVAGGPVALLSYHVRDKSRSINKKQINHSPDDLRNNLVLQGRNYTLLMTANYSGDGPFDAYPQTNSILDAMNALIEQHGMNMLDNAIRTWIFVRDVDIHYKNMVRSRREFFAKHGLTDRTRYLASTGILGIPCMPEKIVSIDSISIGGLQKGQIIRMEAPENLSHTILYGVTFERGLRVRFGDRSHLHISGTASINNQGEVMHLGDPIKQAKRTIENVRALLSKHNATLKDMVYIIAYVRNFHDRDAVGKVIKSEIGARTPLIFAEAAVCRPTWLVELEGIAIIPDKTDFPPFI